MLAELGSAPTRGALNRISALPTGSLPTSNGLGQSDTDLTGRAVDAAIARGQTRRRSKPAGVRACVRGREGVW